MSDPDKSSDTTPASKAPQSDVIEAAAKVIHDLAAFEIVEQAVEVGLERVYKGLTYEHWSAETKNSAYEFVLALLEAGLLATSTDQESVELAESLTHQSCENDKHPDWYINSEHNILCPWCNADRAKERASKLEAELAQTRTEIDAFSAAQVIELKTEIAQNKEGVESAGRVLEHYEELLIKLENVERLADYWEDLPYVDLYPQKVARELRRAASLQKIYPS